MIIKPDLLSRLDRHLTGPASPAADLYFAWPCARAIGTGEIRQLAPTVFQYRQTLIVIRHTLGLQEGVACDRLIYVMDDDWRSGLRSKELPLSYRSKLAMVEARAARYLEPLAEVIVTGSDILADSYRELFPHKSIEVMVPTWPCPEKPIIQPDKARRIAYLGSWSHRLDFKLIDAALTRALEVHDDLEVFITGNVRPSAALRRHERLKIVAPLTWPDYIDWLRKQTFDICLYPLRATSFNAGRSMNKLLEYCQTSAATIASDTWHLSGAGGQEGLFIPVTNRDCAWTETLGDVIEDKEQRQRVAEKARQVVCQLDIQEHNWSRWSHILEVEGPQG